MENQVTPTVAVETVSDTPVSDTSSLSTPVLPAEVPKMVNKVKLKIDNAEYEESLPFDVPENQVEYIVKQLQLAKVAQKRMQETSDLKKTYSEKLEETARVQQELEKDIANFFVNLKNDPIGTLSAPELMEAGIDLDMIVKMRHQQALEESAKSPDQKERERIALEYKKIKEENEAIKQQTEKLLREQQIRELEAQTAKNRQEYEKQITEALTAKGLPKNDNLIGRVAHVMRFGLNKGIELPMDEVVNLVKQDIYEESRQILSALGDDDVEGMIGQDRIKAIRNKLFKQMKETTVPSANTIKPTGIPEQIPSTGEKKGDDRVDARDFFKLLKT